MNKFITYISISCIFSLAACGGNSKGSSEKETNEQSNFKISSDSYNNSQEYSQYLEFSSNPVELKVNGRELEVDIYPKIKSAAQKINDNEDTELILLNEAGDQLASLHPFGRDSHFEDALYSGDKAYNGELTFIEYEDSEEEAQNIAMQAKKYKIIMPLTERVIKVNKYPDWTPQGKYDIEDASGRHFQLIIKKGGSAELINKSYADEEGYTPSKGSWSHNKEEGYVSLSFFNGPFIRIGTHDYFTSPILTPDYIYYDSTAYEDDSDYLEVKKVE